MTDGRPPGALPLAGLHILDLSTYVAGPSAAMTLGQLGADVVRVDPIGGATDTRRLPLAPNGDSLYWAGLNKGKRSIEVDLRNESGRDVVRRLLAAPGDGHGILLTNAVGQTWLAPQMVQRARPDVIQVHIAGRPDGRPAVDYTVNCEVGLPWITGPTESNAPVNHVLPAWDLLTGMHAALALVAAERARRMSGQPQTVELDLADVAACTMAHLGFVGDVVVNRTDRLREGNYLYGSYGCDFATRDGRRVMVVALTSRHWSSLVELTGIGDVLASLERSLKVDFAREQERYAHRDLISALLRPWFAVRSHHDVVAALERAQVLWGDYRSVEEMVNSPDGLIATTGLFEQVDQPGVGRFPVPRACARSTSWPSEPAKPAPRVGADTHEVLRDWLGLDDDEIAELASTRSIGGVAPSFI